MLIPFGTFFNSSVSSLPISGFKLAKSAFLANSGVSIPAAFVYQILMHY